MMKYLMIASALIVACVICGCAPATRTAVSAESTVRKVFQADLPGSVTNTEIWAVSLMTSVVYGRFECEKPDLLKFLMASALLPDQLEDGANPLRGIQKSNLPWWQPGSLQEASGIECDWDVGSDVASCQFAAGSGPDSNRAVVYFMVIYENKNQTGLRPATKADPNWGQQTNGVSNKPDARDGL